MPQIHTVHDKVQAQVSGAAGLGCLQAESTHIARHWAASTAQQSSTHSHPQARLTAACSTLPAKARTQSTAHLAGGHWQLAQTHGSTPTVVLAGALPFARPSQHTQRDLRDIAAGSSPARRHLREQPTGTTGAHAAPTRSLSALLLRHHVHCACRRQGAHVLQQGTACRTHPHTLAHDGKQPVPSTSAQPPPSTQVAFTVPLKLPDPQSVVEHTNPTSTPLPQDAGHEAVPLRPTGGLLSHVTASQAPTTGDHDPLAPHVVLGVPVTEAL